MNGNLKSPNFFLIIAIFFSAIVLFISGNHTYRVMEDVLENSEHAQIIRARVSNIRFWDEVLTGSTLLAANTGDAKWEKRYRLYEPKLENAISELLKSDSIHTFLETSKMTDSSYVHLMSMERRVFELIHLNRQSEANEILTSNEYARQKAIYSEGLSTFINLHELDTTRQQMNLQTEANRSKWFFGLVILLLVIVWLPIERALRKNRTQLLQQNQELEFQIQARKNSESALYESKKQIEKTQEQLQDSIKASSIGLWEWNMPTNEFYQSPEFKNQIGYEDDEVESSSEFYFSHLHPEDAQIVTESIQQLKTGAIDKLGLEYRFRHKDGSYRWMLASASLQRDQYGKPLHMFGSHIDITERKNSEQLIRELNERFSLIARATNDCVYDWDLSTNLVWWNPGLNRLFNYPPEIITTDYLWWEEKIHPDDLDSLLLVAQKVFDEQLENWSGEYRFKRAEGSYAYVFDRAFILYDKDKNPIRWIGSVMDITERKNTEEKLKESEENYRILAESSPEMIYLIDTKGYVTYVNKVAAAQFRAPAQELVGKHLKDIFPPDLAQQNLAGIQNVIVTKNNFQSEVEMVFPTGNRWVDARLTPVFDEKNQIIGVLGLSNDITERKQNEAEIEKINKELTRLNSEKDKFFSIIAHDLRSPFNSIIGLSEILVEQVMEKNYQGIEEYTRIILQSSHRAMDLLMNLMEWSRSQTGRMEFNPEHFEMAELINEVAFLLADAAEQKSITVTKTLPDNVPVYADKNMMSAVLRNLISNAIKFTHPGGEIIISAEGKGGLTASVSDNGVGIPKKRIEQLFRIDENYSTYGTQNEKGTGLGLILCKEFIEKHGGKIWVESEEKKGSIFYFTIP